VPGAARRVSTNYISRSGDRNGAPWAGRYSPDVEAVELDPHIPALGSRARQLQFGAAPVGAVLVHGRTANENGTQLTRKVCAFSYADGPFSPQPAMHPRRTCTLPGLSNSKVVEELRAKVIDRRPLQWGHRHRGPGCEFLAYSCNQCLVKLFLISLGMHTSSIKPLETNPCHRPRMVPPSRTVARKTCPRP